jgi:phosphodiesterase/alkaline phosphatase D-like protein
MRELTRRDALRGALGAGLAVTLSPFLTAGPAFGAVPNRVRVTTGTAYGAARTSLGARFPAPAAGNLLLAVVSVDGSAGAFRAPVGWRIAFQRVGTSLSLAALYRVGTGTESSAAFRWTTSSAGGSWIVAEYTGIDSTDPLGPVRNPGYSDSPRTSMVLNPPAAESESIPLAVFGIDAMDPSGTGRAGAEFKPSATGWDWIATSCDTAQAACPGTALTEARARPTAGQDLAGSRFSWLRSDQVIGAVLQLNVRASAPALVSRWVGALTQTGATVAVKVANASTARLAVSSDPALATDVRYSAAAAPDGDGIAKLVIDGLVPGTQYHYAVELDGVADSTAVGSFRTSPATAASFTFAFGSCCNAPGADTFSEIRGHDPDFFLHLGDLHYGDIALNDPALYRARYDAALASASQRPLYANVPTVYTWSDHDFGPNGSDGTSVSKPAAQATYRQYVPSYPLVSPTGGIYQTFTYGRVRFIATDNRSYKSPYRTVDDASKTMLGEEQKRWFKETITSATEPVIIWMNENPWISPARVVDWWGGYSTERAELADFIAASGKNVAIVSGDMHALAADDGTNSPGGIPVFQAAALSGNSSLKGGPYTAGTFPATAGLPVQQYGVMQVADIGTQIALQFTGFQVGGVAALTYTHTFDV